MRFVPLIHWKLYEQALKPHDLMTVEQHGVVRVIPTRSHAKAASHKLDEPLPSLPPTENLVVLDADAPTEITEVIKSVETWSGRKFAMTPDVNGKVQIFSPKPIDKAKAYHVFRAALVVLGLAETEKAGKPTIMPMKEFAI